MFSRRKTTSRRAIEHDEWLEVENPLDLDKDKDKRKRFLNSVLGVFIALAVAVAVFWVGGWLVLERLIYRNEAFAISQIQVQTDGILSAEAIRGWSGVRSGDNLLGLDLMRVKRNLESQACIDTVAVERLLPRTLRLRVTEREPVAQTIVWQPRPDGNYEKIVYQFDDAGYTMRPLDVKYLAQAPLVSPDQLPMLLGVQVSELQSGQRVESPQILGALQLLTEFDRSPMVGLAELQRINVSYPEILLVTTSQGAEITFSLSRFDTQLRRWRLVYDKYAGWSKAISSLDLSISNNCPVKYVAANTVQPIVPKARPQRRKK
jgi:cell division septal protein FtsQ